MPAQSNPNALGTDPSLLDNPAVWVPPSDLDRPLANSPSASSNSPAPPDDPPERRPGEAKVNRLGTEKSDRLLDIALPYSGSWSSYAVGYTTGHLTDIPGGNKDIIIANYRGNDFIDWERQYGSAGDDVATAIAFAPYNPSFFGATGYTDGDFAGAGFGGKDVWFANFTPTGQIIDSETFKWGSAGDDIAEAIAIDNENNIYLAGSTTGDLVGKNNGGKDAWVAKFNREGVLQWTHKVGTAGDDAAMGIAIDDTGSIFVTGYSTNTWQDNNLGSGSSSAWIFKLDRNGLREGQDYITGGDTKAYDIAVGNYGDVYITGSTTGDLNGTNAGGMDAWFASYDRYSFRPYNQTNPNWLHQLGTTGDDIAYSINLDGENRVHIAGSTTGSIAGTAVGGKDAWFAQYETHNDPMQPTLKWKQQLGTTGDDVAMGIASGRDGYRHFLTGYSDKQLGNHRNYGPDPIGGSESSEDMWMAAYTSRNEAPNLLHFNLNRGNYQQRDTLEISYGEVGDRDTIYDISHIDFRIIKSDGTEIDLPDAIADIRPMDWQQQRGYFNYSINLNRYGLEQGNYTLKGTVVDRAGHTDGATFEQMFSIASPLTNQAPEGLDFHIKDDWQTFTPGQFLEVEYGRVFDYDGASNLTQIDFELISPDGTIIQLPEATQIYAESGYPDDPYARFDYRVQLPTDLQLSGAYFLKAIAYDGSGATSNIAERYANVNMHGGFSSGPYFNLDRYDYGGHETIKLEKVRIHHPDGIDKIESVQFFVSDYRNNTEIALGKVTQWTEYGFSDGEFDLNINLGTLGLEQGDYGLFARIYDIAGRPSDRLNTQNFYVRSHDYHNYPPQFQLARDLPEYKNTEILSIRDGWVSHYESIDGVSRVDFRLQKASGDYSFIDLPDAIEFNVQDPLNATFEYAVDLSQYDLEVNQEYSLWAVVYDALGYSSSPMFQQFYVRENMAPMGISFNLNASYLSTEIIRINDGIIHDPNGSADINRIEFALRNPDGTMLDLPDVFNFTPHPTISEEASFAHKINLGNYDLDPGAYTVIATGYDIDGAMGHTFEQSFEILSSNSSPESLRFSLDKIDYKPTDILQIKEGWVQDPDGAQDILNIRYDLRKDDGTIVKSDMIGDLTAASWDPLWVSFESEIDLGTLNLANGIYRISAIAYDIANTVSNLFERSFTVTAPPPNVAPSNLTFSLDRGSYTPTETINLDNGWVRDANGANTLEYIDLRIVTEQGNTIDIADIANFNAVDWNPEWASFQHAIGLTDLNLQGGAHKLVGIAYDWDNAASVQFERGFYLEVPEPNLSPADLSFSLNKTTYNPTDTLTIGNGWVQDGDGWEDLASVSFKIVASNGSEIELGELTDFINVGWTQQWASFSGGFDLNRYNLADGTYTLVGMASDRAGGQSQTLSRSFTIEAPQTQNNAPAGLQFGLNGSTFSTSDTLQITNGWVYDTDGNSDLAGVEFELVAEDGTIIDVEDSLALTPATWDWSQQWSSFHHGISLGALGLSAGRYSLRGKAYDGAGDYSNTFSRSFNLV
ncbi:MAG: SBBP repeat-containing protein [Cyanobacteria bacterium SBLK]|nr:SBBP repeat-containing protein [Cyanobacteria bacterium SBLK]